MDTTQDRARRIASAVVTELIKAKSVAAALIMLHDTASDIDMDDLIFAVYKCPKGASKSVPGQYTIRWGTAVLEEGTRLLASACTSTGIDYKCNDGAVVLQAPPHIINQLLVLYGTDWGKRAFRTELTEARERTSVINSRARRVGKLPVYPRSLVTASQLPEWVFLTHGGTIDEDA